MANPALQRLLQKAGHPQLLHALTDTLSLSELNSLLMEVMKLKAARQTPAALLHQYQQNRFVQPSAIPALAHAEAAQQVLALADQQDFEALTLSPLAPLGNCSVIARADQNKVVTALRGTEVVADATNLLALEAAMRRQQQPAATTPLHLCAIHRHVRAQALPPGKGFTAHFQVFCAVTAGRDTGSRAFEAQALLAHLTYYERLLETLLPVPFCFTLKTFPTTPEEETAVDKIKSYLQPHFRPERLAHEAVDPAAHRYYQLMRFSLDVQHKGHAFNLGDGGFVDWSQQLTQNRKERLFTSGLGLELLLKLKLGMIG